MDEKLVTNGTELPAGAELPVEAGRFINQFNSKSWFPVEIDLPVEAALPIKAELPVETGFPIETGLPVKAVLPDETGSPAITEFVSHSYSYLINKFQNSIISEFIHIVTTLELTHWLVFLFSLSLAILVFIYKKVSTKPLSDSPCYIRIDNLYENHDHFMGLILFSSFVFVSYAYNVTGHEYSYLKYVELGMLSILVSYLAWIPVYITRYFLVLKWKKETLKFFENSPGMVFEDYKIQAKQYKWKNKGADKTYRLYLEKTLTSDEILKKQLDPYKTDLKRNKVITSAEQPIKPPKVLWTKTNWFCFWATFIIVFTIAWNAGGWWWLFAFFCTGSVISNIGRDNNVKQEIEIKKRSEALNISTNEDFITRPPVASVLTEHKVITSSDPAPQNDFNNKTVPKPKKSSSALGIWTFIAFVIAFFVGGWWWVLAIIMGLIWLSKKGENTQENISAQSTAPVITTNIPTNNLSDWAKQLTDICAQYSGDHYYVAELIPAKKLENAMKRYPMPGFTVALIDATVFGSADNGMLIGKNGISWHNGYPNKSGRTMKWDYFALQKIIRENANIKIGADNIFDMSGCKLAIIKYTNYLNVFNKPIYFKILVSKQMSLII